MQMKRKLFHFVQVVNYLKAHLKLLMSLFILSRQCEFVNLNLFVVIISLWV